MDEESENPYVLLIAKKIRALRKKVEKVKALEGQQDLGKELNDEQIVLLNSKGGLERSLKEHELLKTQLEEVARDEQEPAKAGGDNGAAPVEEPEPPVVAEPEPEPVEEPANGLHEPVVNHEQMTQTDPEQPPPPPPPPPPPARDAAPKAKSAAESPDRKSVEMLLKLLHVVGRYEGHTGSPLPSEVDYFGKVILGKTSLPEDNFFDALTQSVNDAVLYLERGEHSNNQVANGKTYKQLRELVDLLADALCQPATPTKANPPPSPQLKINFFADPTGALDDAALALPPLGGEGNLPSALDSVSEANVDALVNPSSILAEPSAVHQAITVETPVEIAGLQPAAPIEVVPSSQHDGGAELSNAIILDSSAIVTDPMPLPQDMVIGVSTPMVPTGVMQAPSVAPGSVSWMPQEMPGPAAWMPPVSAMTAMPEGPGSEKIAAARRSRQRRGRGGGHNGGRHS